MTSLTEIFDGPTYAEFKKDKIYVYCDLIDYVSKFHAFDVAAVEAACQLIENTSESDRDNSIKKFQDSRDFHKGLLDGHVASLGHELDCNGCYGDLEDKIREALDEIMNGQDS